MTYIEDNKAAWEEAFEHKLPGWGEDNAQRLRQERLPFLWPDLVQELAAIDWHDKTIAQFCCNNGRELLALMQLGAQSGVGFDIAENIIAQAADTAQKAGLEHCQFVACDILAIPATYNERFDLILFTIGAITWFRHLPQLFHKTAACLKPGGLLVLQDFHPFMNMLPMPGEAAFDAAQLDRVAYSYFRQEPWIENEGMGYMSETYASKTFTSFSHTLSDIINALTDAQLRIRSLKEYDYDIGLTDVYDHQGLPLSFILTAAKDQ